jgi:hypothetical protein
MGPKRAMVPRKRPNPFEAIQALEPSTGEAAAAADSSGNRVSSRGRKKAAVKPPPTELAQQTSDQVAKQQAAYLFTAIVDCAILDPTWGFGHDANRSLLPDHIQRVLTAFSDEGIRRFEVECRMKASINSNLSTRIRASLSAADQRRLESGASATKQSDYVLLEWAHDWPRPTLEAGQHRRAAIMMMNGLDPLQDKSGVIGTEDLRSKVSKTSPW